MASWIGSSSSGYSFAPFVDGHAIHWQRKEVLVDASRLQLGAILHEMGHVFACQEDPNTDGGLDELEWLGWEIALARAVGCYDVWDRQNGNYQVLLEEGREWGQLDVATKLRFGAERMQTARELGLLDADFRPLAVR